MTTFRKAEVVGEPDLGGFIVGWPSGAEQIVHWRSALPIEDPKAAATQYAATLLESLLRREGNDDANRTNWVSATACIQQFILEFNAERRMALTLQ